MLVALAGLLIAVLAVLLVLEPVLRSARGERIAPSVNLLADDDEDEDPLRGRKQRALAALREIEFDQATGKLSDEDYQKLYAKYSAEAMEAIREADTGDRGPGTEETDAVEALIAFARSSRPRDGRPGAKFCEECGAGLEGSRRFCVECGSRVIAALG